MIKWTAVMLVIGFLLDLLIGDPRWLYHPVRIIGNSITFFEKWLRKWFPKSPSGEKMAGCVLVMLICLESSLAPFVLLFLAFKIHTAVGIVLGSFFCYQMLATKSLKDESMRVYDKLEHGTIEEARVAVSMIVGRDTQNLNKEGVTKATVETVAENTSDGIIAPIFYMAVGGPVLMYLYKGINTMDSMVAYKNDKYLHFGWCAAKLDDIANFIPARISAFLMILAAFVCRLDWKNAWRIFKRDRYNHASPNSAQTEAVMAGALDVALAGNAYYFGKLYEKKTIGDAIRKIKPDDIILANRMLYVAATIGVILFAVIRILLQLI